MIEGFDIYCLIN
jgi:hypothetical protein